MHAALKLIHRRFQQAQPGVTGSPGLATQPATATVTAVPGSTPLVLDSPHSGTQYPDDFGSALDLATLRRAEDTHVEKIYAFAPALGVAWVEAHFPRIYLDANRDTTELDTGLLDGDWPDPISTDPKVLSKVRLGKGLIWKFTDQGEPIYQRQLTVAEVRARIDRCWRPYHAAVAQAIDAAHARHGYSIHLNCHSMPAVAGRFATEFPGLEHADFVVGDRDGTTASPALSALICEHLRACGYSVKYNHPYKGVELVRLGKGLIWKFTDQGEPIYQRQLTVAEVRARIDRCWRPYHAAVAQAIDAAHARHGYSIHLNCHSMPAVAGRFATEFPGLEHADFVVGDRDGTTASPALSALICEHLRACGYSVEYNHPYKGVELVRRYGNPAQHRHSIQVEINRKLYMDETTLAQHPEGMARLQADLQALVHKLLAHDPR